MIKKKIGFTKRLSFSSFLFKTRRIAFEFEKNERKKTVTVDILFFCSHFSRRHLFSDCKNGNVNTEWQHFYTFLFHIDIRSTMRSW